MPTAILFAAQMHRRECGVSGGFAVSADRDSLRRADERTEAEHGGAQIRFGPDSEAGSQYCGRVRVIDEFSSG